MVHKENSVLLLPLYLLSLAIFSVSFYWTVNYIPIHRPIEGFNRLQTKLIYLTNWCLVSQVIYCIWATVDTILRRKPGVSYARRFFSQAITGPLGLFVPFTFWGLYAINRELVYPRAWTGIPEWWNQSVHTLPLLFVLLDRYFNRLQIPRRKLYRSFLCLALLAIVYLTGVIYLGVTKNFWVYPVFQFLDWYGRACFMFMCLMVMGLLFQLSDFLSGFFWS